jgi:hypothetical protein
MTPPSIIKFQRGIIKINTTSSGTYLFHQSDLGEKKQLFKNMKINFTPRIKAFFQYFLPTLLFSSPCFTNPFIFITISSSVFSLLTIYDVIFIPHTEHLPLVDNFPPLNKISRSVSCPILRNTPNSYVGEFFPYPPKSFMPPIPTISITPPLPPAAEISFIPAPLYVQLNNYTSPESDSILAALDLFLTTQQSNEIRQNINLYNNPYCNISDSYIAHTPETRISSEESDFILDNQF